MDGAGVLRALGAQHLRSLAGEGGKLHIAIETSSAISRASVVLPVPA
jgi:hypothetical protein